jgi:hypothetical protein
MMDLDEELAQRVKLVFENFDDGESDMGWALLRTKFPEDRSRKIPLWWFIGIAASLLLVVGLSLFLNRPTQTNIDTTAVGTAPVKSIAPIAVDSNQMTQKNPSLNPAKENLATNSAPKKNKENTAQQHLALQPQNSYPDQSPEKVSPAAQVAEVKKEMAPIVAAQNNAQQHQLLPNKKSGLALKIVNLSPQKIEIKKEDYPFGVPVTFPNWKLLDDPIAHQAPQINTSLAENAIKIRPENLPAPMVNYQAQMAQNGVRVDSAAKEKEQAIAAQNIIKAENEQPKTQKTTEEFLKEQSKNALAQARKKEKEKKQKKNSNTYEVFTGTFLNYYGGSDVKVNGGLGFNASFKVADRLFINLGAGVSQNKLTFNNDVNNPELVSSGSYSSLAKTNGVTETVDVNAQMINIDIPISFKYYTSKQQNFYVAIGLNSNSYVSQKYTFTYRNNIAFAYAASSGIGNLSFAPGNHEVNYQSGFKGFDFARTAIFAFGFNQKIGKSNSLIFEPYFKPAIGVMGDRNLKINSVGLNLKFSFINTKK